MRSGILQLAMACTVLSGSSAFATDPALTCQASKLKAVSKYDACRLKAYSKAARAESSPDFSRCSLARFSDAETKTGGVCTTIGDRADIGDFADFCTDSIAIALAGGELPLDCLTCGEDLETCNTNLSECEGDLSTCEGSLATATSGTATIAQVLAGRTFASSAGIGVTGTMPNNGAVSITPGTASQAIVAGYHNGSGSVAGDADLVAGSIKSGISLFGVSGNVVSASGGATSGQVLSGASFSNASGASTGTMPNNGAVTLTPTTTDQAIAAGYHNGSGTCAGDADLVAGNIKSGVNLFGVNGTAIQATGSATAAQVLSGASFSNASGSSTGTMPNNGAVSITPGTSSQAIAAGYHNGSGSVAGDSDLVAGNIKSGVNLLGVTGTHSSLGGYWKTGQTQCYAFTGSGWTSVSCAGTGQDGEFQRGASRSFTDNGNGTITDSFTGLIWEKLSYDNSIHDYRSSYSWPTAVSTKISTLNSTNFGGYNDWRVPNIVELQSIINFGAVNPAVFSAFHSSCSPGCSVLSCSCGEVLCWSSTTYKGQVSHAYGVNFQDGLTANHDRSSFGLSLRAVRGGL